MSILFDNGFTGETLRTLAFTKAEASMMITAVLNKQNDPSGRHKEFLVPEGQYKGKHVSELPFKYRSHVKKNFPDSRVVQLLTKWESQRKKA
jgi:hypothetical protein